MARLFFVHIHVAQRFVVETRWNPVTINGPSIRGKTRESRLVWAKSLRAVCLDMESPRSYVWVRAPGTLDSDTKTNKHSNVGAIFDRLTRINPARAI